MRRAATILAIFFLGVLVGSVFILPGTGDVVWVMGDIEAVAERLHVGEGFDGYDVSEILNAMVDRLMACCPNVPPTAVDDTVQTVPGATAYFDVLANDSDLDRDGLSVMAVFPAAHGQAGVAYTRFATWHQRTGVAGTVSSTR